MACLPFANGGVQPCSSHEGLEDPNKTALKAHVKAAVLHLNLAYLCPLDILLWMSHCLAADQFSLDASCIYKFIWHFHVDSCLPVHVVILC